MSIIITFNCEIYNTKHFNTYYRSYTIVYQNQLQYDDDAENDYKLAFQSIQNEIHRDELKSIEVTDKVEYNVIVL